MQHRRTGDRVTHLSVAGAGGSWCGMVGMAQGAPACPNWAVPDCVLSLAVESIPLQGLDL